MNDAEVFRTIALAFTATGDAAWKRATAPGTWAPFIDGLRRLMGGAGAFGRQRPPIQSRLGAPLQEALTEQETRALFTPPDAAARRSFASRHFVGGLPTSAIPVESLYAPWALPKEKALTHAKGHYQSTRSLYMRDLLASLGLELPVEFAAYPDHLAVQLEVLAFLIEEGDASGAAQFLLERFAWLSDYRPRLVSLGPEAHFHLALVDALLAMRALQATGEGGTAREKHSDFSTCPEDQ